MGYIWSIMKSTYRSILIEELRKRQRKNPSYSLRAFARDIGVSVSRLSEVLNSKAGLSDSRAALIAEKLQLKGKERAYFIDLVQAEHARSKIAKKSAAERLKSHRMGSQKIADEDFHLIADWQNLAVLELIDLPEMNHNHAEIANRLKITVGEAEATIDRLMQVGLLKEENGKWKPSDPDSTTSSDVPSTAIQNFHRQMLGRAQRSLQVDPVESRDLSSVVFGVDADQLAYAKERIREFRRMLSQELAAMPGKNKVYSMSIQLFELKGDEA
ncbi:TIGR02147 family protein [Bdellovibrio sp. HCB288]|uniref:TIGR02147 family protein n=1 Tax=Bdellovibrio sp. HCB288 TaxID=3394355 RepID=UPI0039B4CC8A